MKNIICRSCFVIYGVVRNFRWKQENKAVPPWSPDRHHSAYPDGLESGWTRWNTEWHPYNSAWSAMRSALDFETAQRSAYWGTCRSADHAGYNVHVLRSFVSQHPARYLPIPCKDPIIPIRHCKKIECLLYCSVTVSTSASRISCLLPKWLYRDALRIPSFRFPSYN